MKQKKINSDIYRILKNIELHEIYSLMTDKINLLNTKEIEKKCSSQIQTSTFYNKFREIREEEYIKSQTNDNDQVVWKLTSIGKTYISSYEKAIFFPEIKTKAKKLEEDHQKNIIEIVKRYRLCDEFKNFKKIKKELKTEEYIFLLEFFRRSVLMNHIDHKSTTFDLGLFDIEIKINKKKINEIAKKIMFSS